MRSLFAAVMALSVLAGPASAQIVVAPDTEDEARLASQVDQINRLTEMIDGADRRIDTATRGRALTPEDFLNYYRQRGRLRACDGGTVADSGGAFTALDGDVTAFVGEGYLGSNDGFGGSDRPEVNASERRASYDQGVGAGCPNRSRLEARILSGPMGQLLILGENREAALALRQRYERLLLVTWDTVDVLVPLTPVERLDE